MKQAKSKKKKEWHASKSQKGMGDYYGTGIRQPLGKMREGMGMYEVPSKKMKIPPKSLV